MGKNTKLLKRKYNNVGAVLLVTDKKAVDSKFWKFFNENEGTSLSEVAYTYKMLTKDVRKRVEDKFTANVLYPDIGHAVYEFEFYSQLFPKGKSGKWCWFIRNVNVGR